MNDGDGDEDSTRGVGWLLIIIAVPLIIVTMSCSKTKDNSYIPAAPIWEPTPDFIATVLADITPIRPVAPTHQYYVPDDVYFDGTIEDAVNICRAILHAPPIGTTIYSPISEAQQREVDYCIEDLMGSQ